MPAAEVAPPGGARGADSFKRLLGCGLSHWETSRYTHGDHQLSARDRIPGRPARDDHHAPGHVSRLPWSFFFLDRKVPAGRPTEDPGAGRSEHTAGLTLLGPPSHQTLARTELCVASRSPVGRRFLTFRA